MPLQADRHSVDPQALLLREKRAIERAQSGELAALEPVLAQHAEALFARILGRVGERAQAEDLLKDTFVTALEKINGFAWQDRSIYHWLRQIALNKVLDHHRALGRRKRLCQALRNELAIHRARGRGLAERGARAPHRAGAHRRDTGRPASALRPSDSPATVRRAVAGASAQGCWA